MLGQLLADNQALGRLLLQITKGKMFLSGPDVRIFAPTTCKITDLFAESPFAR